VDDILFKLVIGVLCVSMIRRWQVRWDSRNAAQGV